MTIRELAQKTVDAMLEMGLSPLTAWEGHSKGFAPIIRWHDERGKEEFDRVVVTLYVRNLEARIDRGDLKPKYYRDLRRGAERLTEMHDTGKLEWTGPNMPSKFKLNDFYQNVLDEFLEKVDFSPKGRSDAMWVCRKYLSWLLLDGHEDLSGVGATQVQRFMIYCSHHMRSASIHDVKLYMRKLYHFLLENGYSTSDFRALLTFRVSRESKLYPSATPEEVAAVLDVIDRRIPRGKRDYAIILLGTVMGLRAGDISKLRLHDIDWKTGEIKLVQGKTSGSLALPLTTDVGRAIKDYILNGRQKSDSDVIFLRLRRPYKGFANGVAIGDLFDYYCKKANVPREAHDGKGFHSLRRSAGKNMVTSGVSVNTAAQVLGDKNINSTKKYISLDSRHLKECALDFTGIAMTEVTK